MVLKRISNTIRRQQWGGLTVELAVVVLGVYLGMQADSWVESRRDHDTEKVYLKELTADFQLNLQDLDRHTTSLELIIANMISLLE